MKDRKKYIEVFIIGMVIILLVGTTSLVSAEEIESIPEGIPFSFTSWIQHTFRIQDFSIVGQDRHCDVYVKEGNTLYFYPNGQNVLMDIDVSDYCSSGYGLIDIFVNNWNPHREYKNSVTRYCGFVYDQCIAEIYCCDHDECFRDSQCEDWEGIGSECEKKIANDPLIDYEFDYYNHCTIGCTGSDITCWREEGGVCVSRTYDCSYGTYPNCPTTYKYTSKSECEKDIPSNGNGIDCTDFKKESDCLVYNECDWVDADSWIIDKHCVAKTENGNGEEWEATKSYDYSEIQSLTASALAESVCNSNPQCPSNSSCIIVNKIIQNGYINEERANIIREDFCEIQEGEGFWSFKAFTDDDYYKTCKALTGKTTFFHNHYGFCISGEEPRFNLDIYFGWAAWFDLTGDGVKDGIDGLIIVIIGGVFLLVLMRRK